MFSFKTVIISLAVFKWWLIKDNKCMLAFFVVNDLFCIYWCNLFIYAPPGSPQGHHIHMRGLPYQVSAEDVVKVITLRSWRWWSCFIKGQSSCDLIFYGYVFLPQFFSPLVVSKITIVCSPEGRPNGEAEVYFNTHQDALSAMSRDRDYIGESGGTAGADTVWCLLFT